MNLKTKKKIIKRQKAEIQLTLFHGLLANCRGPVTPEKGDVAFHFGSHADAVAGESIQTAWGGQLSIPLTKDNGQILVESWDIKGERTRDESLRVSETGLHTYNTWH